VQRAYAGSGSLDPPGAVARLVETADTYRSGKAITDDPTLVVLQARGEPA
jgi:hypothetical protein